MNHRFILSCSHTFSFFLKVMDNAISAIFGHTCGVNITPFANYVGNHTELHESTKVWSFYLGDEPT